MSAVAYFFARHLHRKKDIPVGIVDSTWGGTPAEAWTSAETNLSLPHYRDLMKEILESDRDWTRAFEENDARDASRWERIRDLEKAQSYGVHLPGYDDSSWPTVRLPNDEPLSGFVWLRRTAPLEDAEPSGYELLLGTFEDVNALFVNGVHSGPIFRSMETRERTVVLSFDHTGSGLATRDGEEVRGFAVAGEDRRFAWADARIEGDRVVVRSELVPAPVAVRYAWADNPDCNLTNSEGLPASPFRTDTWPGITE